MKPIIKVENLGKQYRLGEARKPYSTLRESLVESFSSPFKKFRKASEENQFWALNDVNFEVMPGEVVGIIGRNGAGKSTLLKILSRITEPTKGRVELYGRIGSLLEVGTGFHPELTGRENIYLNGAILGMKREEIKQKFDEIVDFAEIEDFLDTPVKRYSSGMYTRLAFSVAANLEPEVLVVDEVLAVGDAQFQQKCLGKMQDVSKNEGRTILFVSHNLGSLSQICNKGILMSKGQLILQENINLVINEYLKSSQNENRYQNTELDKGKAMQIKEIFITNNDEIITSDFAHSESVKVHVKIQIHNFQQGSCCHISILNKYKERIASDVITLEDSISIDCKNKYITYEIPANLLAPNSYSFSASLLVPRLVYLDDATDICPITVHDAGTRLSAFYNFEHGYLLLDGKWQVVL